MLAGQGMTTEKRDDIHETEIGATEGRQITRVYHDRKQAEAAIDRLKQHGFDDDQISLRTQGGHTDESGVFVPGQIEVVVMADARVPEAERLLSGD